jgi:Spy/CpxP family protein refolding chaperone
MFSGAKPLQKMRVSSNRLGATGLATGEDLSGERMEESENPMKITMFRSSMLRVAVLALGATALSALPAMAQDPSAPPPPQDQAGPEHGRGGPGGMGQGGMRGNQVDFLTRKLNLTPDQVTQVKAIDADAMTQMKALHEDTSIAGPDKRAKMMDIHKTSQDKIRALLTDDQKTKFDALQAQMREHRGNHGGGDGPPPPPPTTPQP